MGREGKGREGKGWEGKGREGREGKRTETTDLSNLERRFK
jgi:hypothetical protein